MKISIGSANLFDCDNIYHSNAKYVYYLNRKLLKAAAANSLLKLSVCLSFRYHHRPAIMQYYLTNVVTSRHHNIEKEGGELDSFHVVNFKCNLFVYRGLHSSSSPVNTVSWPSTSVIYWPVHYDLFAHRHNINNAQLFACLLLSLLASVIDTFARKCGWRWCCEWW